MQYYAIYIENEFEAGLLYGKLWGRLETKPLLYLDDLKNLIEETCKSAGNIEHKGGDNRLVLYSVKNIQAVKTPFNNWRFEFLLEEVGLNGKETL